MKARPLMVNSCPSADSIAFSIGLKLRNLTSPKYIISNMVCFGQFKHGFAFINSRSNRTKAASQGNTLNKIFSSI